MASFYLFIEGGGIFIVNKYICTPKNIIPRPTHHCIENNCNWVIGKDRGAVLIYINGHFSLVSKLLVKDLDINYALVSTTHAQEIF